MVTRTQGLVALALDSDDADAPMVRRRLPDDVYLFVLNKVKATWSDEADELIADEAIYSMSGF